MPRLWPDPDEPFDPHKEQRMRWGLNLFIAGWIVAGIAGVGVLFT